jgi:hypothetical protein
MKFLSRKNRTKPKCPIFPEILLAYSNKKSFFCNEAYKYGVGFGLRAIMELLISRTLTSKPCFDLLFSTQPKFCRKINPAIFKKSQVNPNLTRQSLNQQNSTTYAFSHACRTLDTS